MKKNNQRVGGFFFLHLNNRSGPLIGRHLLLPALGIPFLLQVVEDNLEHILLCPGWLARACHPPAEPAYWTVHFDVPVDLTSSAAFDPTSRVIP